MAFQTLYNCRVRFFIFSWQNTLNLLVSQIWISGLLKAWLNFFLIFFFGNDFVKSYWQWYRATSFELYSHFVLFVVYVGLGNDWVFVGCLSLTMTMLYVFVFIGLRVKTRGNQVQVNGEIYRMFLIEKPFWLTMAMWKWSNISTYRKCGGKYLFSQIKRTIKTRQEISYI